MPIFLKALRTIVRWIFTPIVALILLFEEWGWVPLSALVSRLARLPLWARVEGWIKTLPPWAALLVMLVPTLALIPVKLLALYLFSQVKTALGLTVLIAAKLISTALVARLFYITQPTLMQLAWFAKWYPRWKTWKDGLMDSMRASFVWRAARSIKVSVKRTLGRLWRKLRA
jgi:hypothetical protein